MVLCGVVFGKIIHVIGIYSVIPFTPVYFEVSSRFLILQPIEAQIPRFVPFLVYTIFCEAECGHIISFQKEWRSGVSKMMEDTSQHHVSLRIIEDASNLRLRCRRNGVSEQFSFDENGVVD